ncbi:MAG: hypothetical protein QF464_24230, partial [Myxococcota bacterium]|nr:hypothetical protein [Myxococcota bacterium]
MAIKYSDVADLRVWDTTSATEPVELASYAHPTGTSSDGIALAKGHVYLGLFHDLVVFDATCLYPQTCSAEGQCMVECMPSCQGLACGDDGCGGSCGECCEGGVTELTELYVTHSVSVAAAGSHLYVAASAAGIESFDISKPGSPESSASLDVGGSVAAVAAGPDGYLVAGMTSGGIHVIDVSDPSAPAVVGSLDGGNTRDVAVEGDVAVAGTDEGYAQFVSLADPTAPTLLSTHEMSSPIWGVDVVGGLAYIATFSAIDVVNVATGATLWTVTHDAGANFKVQVSGDR